MEIAERPAGSPATAATAWLPDALRAKATVIALEPRATLFRQGEPARAIFAVEAGGLRLVRRTVDDHPVTLHTARVGELFAEAALFSDTYQCDAIATQATRVRAFDKPALLAVLRHDPALAARFLEVLAHQVLVLRARLELRNIRSARERILQHLRLAGMRPGAAVPIEGSLKDLAAELGLSHEAFYRALAALERAGTIRRQPHAIVVLKTADI